MSLFELSLVMDPCGDDTVMRRADLLFAHRTRPKTPKELNAQFRALCQALGLDPTAPNVLDELRDPERVLAERMVRVIEGLGEHGTFRGAFGGSWWPISSRFTASSDQDAKEGENITDPNDPMEFQRSGTFAHALRTKGVHTILLGDLSAEWYLYSIAHPLERALSPASGAEGSWISSITEHLTRYFQPEIVRRLVDLHPPHPQQPLYPELERLAGAGASKEDAMRIFGQILADAQVHLPVRMLWRDLTTRVEPRSLSIGHEEDFEQTDDTGKEEGLKVVRYAIRWTPEQVRPLGEWILWWQHNRD
jgi:hypothetical protein